MKTGKNVKYEIVDSVLNEILKVVTVNNPTGFKLWSVTYTIYLALQFDNHSGLTTESHHYVNNTL